MAMNPSKDDPQHDFHNQLQQGLDLAQEQLNQNATPRVTVASKVVQATGQREVTGKAVETAPTNPARSTRHELSRR